ncbi:MULTISPECIES: hypothetical protein [Citrobacter]|uniref:Small CPxCG-related zinc finger protein n=1 Tax=Citrobacter braakii TaxID=57706 RepID=A0ABR6TTL9_CITBR|nr:MULTISPECIES: hypothetical protein [Citrobacter]MBC2610766.1 hypothetical protein [Citrobacter braakii]MBC2634190.1 hypothetical protein [Citrobacter braakii]MBC2646909.1 hypothetical protein [Citrobacter braakii]MDM3436960.1 DUF3268 family zinc-finger domain-containing protein [Citrobacter sp. Cb034]WFO45355.1 DUF3268 family zinc-finger domain-containing protein [Citrobacter braakii]
MANENEVQENKENTENLATVRFCPICGEQMYQGMRYGFLCWICPECDFDEPVK